MLKWFLLTTVVNLSVTYLSTSCILNNIEKHSIHPVHARVIEIAGKRICMPWDDCK